MIDIGTDFSGIGAFEQALIKKNVTYNTVFACDSDKYVRKSYIANYGKPAHYPTDVYDRVIPEKSLDIYVSTPPCQSFSIAGKRSGENDDRGILFYNSHQFILQNKPRFFIFENVEGLLSIDGGKVFKVWTDLLGGKSVNGNPVLFPLDNAAPYHIYFSKVNAINFQIPQSRKRVFIFGIRDDADNKFTWPKKQFLQKRLRDVLETNVDKKYHLSEKMQAYINNRSANFNNGKINYKTENDIASCITKSAGSIDISDNIIVIANTNPSGNGMNGNVYSTNGIAPTITTNKGEGIKIQSANAKGYETAFAGDSFNISHLRSATRRGKVGRNVAQTITTDCNQAVIVNQSSSNNYILRKLTPRENLRLFGFSDSFKIVCSDRQLYHQTGNSVVVNIFEALIDKILKIIEK